MDEKLIASLGLNASEAKVYKAVIKAGRLSPAAIGRSTGIKRTTAYSVARGLVDKGLLLEDATKRPRVFLPAFPQDILGIISQERKQLEAREKVLKSFAAELSRAEAGKSYPVPQIRFVGEDKLERFQLAEMDKWQDSVMKRDKTWWGFQDHTWVETFGHLIPDYWKKVPNDLELKFLSNAEGSPAEVKLSRKFPKRVIKYWAKANNFVSSLWITGDYVTILNTRRHPFYLFEIHDATLANDLREVFKNLWPLV